MKRQHSFKPPLRQYVDIINQGYQDCNLDREYLKKKIKALQYRIVINEKTISIRYLVVEGRIM